MLTIQSNIQPQPRPKATWSFNWKPEGWGDFRTVLVREEDDGYLSIGGLWGDDRTRLFLDVPASRMLLHALIRAIYFIEHENESESQK